MHVFLLFSLPYVVSSIVRSFLALLLSSFFLCFVLFSFFPFCIPSPIPSSLPTFLSPSLPSSLLAYLSPSICLPPSFHPFVRVVFQDLRRRSCWRGRTAGVPGTTACRKRERACVLSNFLQCSRYEIKLACEAPSICAVGRVKLGLGNCCLWCFCEPWTDWPGIAFLLFFY